MSSVKLPIVRVSVPLGAAAKLASQARVSAFLFQQGAELSLINVQHLPSMSDGTVGDVVGHLGRPVPALDGFATGDFADVEVGEGDHASINSPIGFMQCSVNPDHIYPPSFPSGGCPQHDGGTLELEYF